MTGPGPFATRLRWWRGHRGLSQLELSGRADTSQRHLSFLELGRASPSREMVLRLAVALEIPLRQQNELLLAAGFAPVWHRHDLSTPELATVAGALERMLAQQEPFPAVVVDRQWNLLRANRGAVQLVEFLLGPLEPGAGINLADALAAPDILRPHLVNWREVVSYFIRLVEADAAADGTKETAALLARLLDHDGVRATLAPVAPAPQFEPVLPMHFRKGDADLRLFTTITTLGTPRDITLQELRVECFFPMDEATADRFRRLAACPARP